MPERARRAYHTQWLHRGKAVIICGSHVLGLGRISSLSRVSIHSFTYSLTHPFNKQPENLPCARHCFWTGNTVVNKAKHLPFWWLHSKGQTGNQHVAKYIIFYGVIKVKTKINQKRWKAGGREANYIRGHQGVLF